VTQKSGGVEWLEATRKLCVGRVCTPPQWGLVLERAVPLHRENVVEFSSKECRVFVHFYCENIKKPRGQKPWPGAKSTPGAEHVKRTGVDNLGGLTPQPPPSTRTLVPVVVNVYTEWLLQCCMIVCSTAVRRVLSQHWPVIWSKLLIMIMIADAVMTVPVAMAAAAATTAAMAQHLNSAMPPQ